MMLMLETLKTALSTTPGVASCRIGLEANITPEDYPTIRIVPTLITPAIETIGGVIDTRRAEVLIYFGAAVQPFDDMPDSGGRVLLEKTYAALFALESEIMARLIPYPAGIKAVSVIETLTDEDRLEAYKLMAIRAEVEG